MAELGVPINAWQARGVNSITVKVSTTFRMPLRLQDAFYATSAVRSVSRSQVVLAEAVRRRSDDAVVAVSLLLFVGGRGRRWKKRKRKKENPEDEQTQLKTVSKKKKKTVLRGDLRDRRQRLQGGEDPGGGPSRPGVRRGKVRGRGELNFVSLSFFFFVSSPFVSFVPPVFISFLFF